MRDKKHIDRLFQEKFRDFEVSPNEQVWQNISSKINSSRKKRRILPLWSRIAGAAAVLAVIFSINNDFWLNNENPVANTEKPSLKPQPVSPVDPIITLGSEPMVIQLNPIMEDVEFPEVSERKLAGKNEKPIEEIGKEIFTEQNFENRNSQVTLFSFLDPLQLEQIGNIAFASTSLKNSTENGSKDDSILENPLYQLEAEKKEQQVIADGKPSNIKVSTFAAPVYYNGLGNNNIIDPEFSDNEKEGEVTMSYGVSLAYAISDKVKIRSGVSRVTMSYNTMGIAYGSAVDPVALRNVNYDPAAQQLQVQDYTAISSANSFLPEIQNGGSAKNPGYLNQRLGYIELPLEIEFAIVDKRFGINLIGGASTLFLNENSISIHAGDFSTELGESNNLNNVSFSTNIGVGMDYNISKRFQFNLEPMFKYQINTFSSGSFQPFYIGVYSGVSYKF